MSFEALGLDEALLKAVSANGYQTPTPIQTRAIPPILRGGDVIGLAQTGTGKTAAFVLPILQRLKAGREKKIRCLILTPTRELAEQVHDVVRTFAKNTGLRSTTIYGGVNFERQVRALHAGVDIVVGCPGRVLDHIRQRTIRLEAVEIAILDEADQLLDMGFLPSLRSILRVLPKERQSLMFSATMADEIRTLAEETLSNPELVQVAKLRPVSTIDQALYPISQDLKNALLLRLLSRIPDGESVLVFMRTKHRAKRLGVMLESSGYRAASLQGNLSQNRRMAVMKGFRSGEYQIMVATDIASRGIDISQIAHVINFDMPDTVEAYTHRIGRTGRAERTGSAYTFVTREDERDVRSIERVLNMRIERRILEDFDYRARPEPVSAAQSVRENGKSEQRNRRFGGGGQEERRRQRASGNSNTSRGGRNRHYRGRRDSQRDAERIFGSESSNS